MEQILSKLTIKVFHMDEVVIGDQNIVTSQGKLQVCPVWFVDNEFIDHVDIKIISPDDHSMTVTSVMDVTPISTKVLGKLGEGVTVISDDTFAWCSSLKSLTLPKGITRIGASAFFNCVSLETFVIPEGVSSIGESAFEWCTSLKSVVIPESMMIIGDLAFENCTGLTDIYYRDSEDEWGSIAGGVLISVGDGVKLHFDYKEEK